MAERESVILASQDVLKALRIHLISDTCIASTSRKVYRNPNILGDHLGDQHSPAMEKGQQWQYTNSVHARSPQQGLASMRMAAAFVW